MQPVGRREARKLPSKMNFTQEPSGGATKAACGEKRNLKASLKTSFPKGPVEGTPEHTETEDLTYPVKERRRVQEPISYRHMEGQRGGPQETDR